MKKILLLAVVMFSSLTASAQFYAGGSIGFGSVKPMNGGDSEFTFKILPEIGYTLNDKFDIAVGIGFTHFNGNGDAYLSFNDKDDYSCMVMMDEDCAVTDIKFFKVVDPMDLVARLSAIINTTPSLASVTVETNSLGEVYRSALKKKMNRPGILKPFETTNESKRRIIEQLIKAFSEEDIKIVEEQKLKEQLQHYQIEQTPSGKITYNAQGGFNDDAVIALALAYDAASAGKTKKKIEISFV